MPEGEELRVAIEERSSSSRTSTPDALEEGGVGRSLGSSVNDVILHDKMMMMEQSPSAGTYRENPRWSTQSVNGGGHILLWICALAVDRRWRWPEKLMAPGVVTPSRVAVNNIQNTCK